MGKTKQRTYIDIDLLPYNALNSLGRFVARSRVATKVSTSKAIDTKKDMTRFSSFKVTRRNFLQLLVATGGSLLAAGLLRTLETTNRLAYADRIKNIIIFIQENHSFDSLFAGFPGANSKFSDRECTDSLLRDPPHTHADAFEPDGATTVEARCSYIEADAPNYWKAARAFTLCDNYFSGVRGPSHPNFLMMITGQSPIVNAPSPFDLCPHFCLDIPALPHRLDAKELTWRDYGGIFTSIKSLAGRPEVMDYQDEKFFEDAEKGALRNVAWLNSGFLTDAYTKSGHPPASLCGGENYAVSVLNAVMSSSKWSTNWPADVRF